MAYLTYFDLVESLIVSSYGGPQDAEQRDIRTAIHKAYAEVTQIRDWSYYHVHGRIITQAPYSTGTVTSSGTTVTLTGGSWPSWAATGAYLKVGEEICRVASRTSNSIIVLDSVIKLKANVTAQPYTLYRTLYPLPSDFRNLDEPSDEYNWWSGLYLTPDQAMKMERVSNSSGEPYHWTILKDTDSTGWAIKLLGYPTKAETIDFMYRRTARPIKYSGHEAATRATGALGHQGGADIDEIYVSGKSFPEDIIGSIVRVGDSSSYPGTIESLKPYSLERVITGITDLNGTRDLIQVSPQTPVNFSSSNILVTDPIDVAPHMQQAVDSCCDYWLARIRGVKADGAFSMYQRDLRLAFEMDQLAPLSGRSRSVWHDGGWRSPLLADVG
jgi:hypothetical protein